MPGLLSGTTPTTTATTTAAAATSGELNSGPRPHPATPGGHCGYLRNLRCPLRPRRARCCHPGVFCPQPDRLPLQRDDALRRMGAHQRPQKLRHDAQLGRACYWAEGQSRLEWPQRKAQMPAGVSARRSRFPPNGGLIIGTTSRGNRMTYMLASLRARVCWLACLPPAVNLLGVSAVKVWLRDCSVLAGGIHAIAPAPHLAHQSLCFATMPFHPCSDGLRGDARDTAEQ
jgi:hypothetical protein